MSNISNIPEYLNRDEIPEGELEYHPNGSIKREKMIVDEKLSKIIYYNDKGLIQKIEDIDEKGQVISGIEMGTETSQHGLSFTYYPNGSVQSLKYFINGKVNWVEKIFSEEGQLTDVVTYNKGVKTGPHSIYGKRSSKVGEINYKQNKPSGPAKYYYESGELKAEINYKEGKKEGVSKFFHKNGNLRKKESYSEGTKNGQTTLYYENGAIKEKWNFEGGELSNECVKYNMLGEEVERKYYSGGKVVPEPEQVTEEDVKLLPHQRSKRQEAYAKLQKEREERSVEKKSEQEDKPEENTDETKPKEVQPEIIAETKPLEIKKPSAEEIRKRKIKLAFSYTGIFIGSIILIYIIYNIIIYFL